MHAYAAVAGLIAGAIGVVVGSACVFFENNETRTPLTITYRTGMKKRLRVVENYMPPTIAVPTEWRPSLPAPEAK
jgi:hypothetical protein